MVSGGSLVDGSPGVLDSSTSHPVGRDGFELKHQVSDGTHVSDIFGLLPRRVGSVSRFDRGMGLRGRGRR